MNWTTHGRLWLLVKVMAVSMCAAGVLGDLLRNDRGAIAYRIAAFIYRHDSRTGSVAEAQRMVYLQDGLRVVVRCLPAVLVAMFIYGRRRPSKCTDGYARCAHCGYIVDYSPGPRCPECGDVFRKPGEHVEGVGGRADLTLRAVSRRRAYGVKRIVAIVVASTVSMAVPFVYGTSFLAVDFWRNPPWLPIPLLNYAGQEACLNGAVATVLALVLYHLLCAVMKEKT
ncbi:MAG: hypothetical protein ABIG44_00895 [Planctomycetota bacterium]